MPTWNATPTAEFMAFLDTLDKTPAALKRAEAEAKRLKREITNIDRALKAKEKLDKHAEYKRRKRAEDKIRKTAGQNHQPVGRVHLILDDDRQADLKRWGAYA